MKRIHSLGALAATAALACAGSAWGAIFKPDPNSPARAILPLPDGDIVVGGDFNRINDAPHDGIARLNPDGSNDDAFVASANGRVSAIVRLPDGKLLIGGNFTQVNGVMRESLARLDADGNLDPTFAGLNFENNYSTAGVGEIHPLPGGKILIVGGSNYGFTGIGGQRRAGIARLNADGTLDTAFDPADIGPSEDSPVFSAAVQPDGKIVVGGSMLVGDQLQYLARLNADGSLDGSFPLNGANASVNSYVRHVMRQDDGKLIIRGDFATPYPQVARFNADGTLDAGYDVAARLPMSTLQATLLQADGKLLVGGYDPAGPAVARFNADGSADTSLQGPRVRYVVNTLGVQADGKLIISGVIEDVGGYPRRNLARLTATGAMDIPDHTVTPAPGAHGTLSPAAPRIVREGETTRFVIQPDDGYHLEAIGGCGGTADGAYYTTGPVTGDCSVTASFAAGARTFTVTPRALFGMLSPPGPQTVRFGQTASFSLSPVAGYYFSSVGGCDGTLNGTTYTTAPVSADCAIDAVFISPQQATAAGGASQSTGTGLAFATPLKVRVLGGYPVSTLPVRGVPVTFEAPANGASATLSATSAVTDANGEASVTAVANGIGGSYAVKVLVAGMAGQPLFFTLNNEGGDSPGIELRVTLSTDPPPACGTSTRLDVTPGTPVNYCFTLVNRTPAPLAYHSLQHSPLAYLWTLDHDQALYLAPIAVPARSTARYHIVVAAAADDVDETFVWAAFADKPRYDVDADAAETFVDISQTGTQVGLETYGVADLPVPFPFTLFGTSFQPDAGDHLCVNNSGTLRLVPGLYTECPSLANRVFPPPFTGDDRSPDADFTQGILPYWDLLGDGGGVYTQVFGDAPKRRFVVQWNAKDHASQPGTDGVTFQAVLTEADGRIRFVYRDLDFNAPPAPALNYGGSARVGLYGNDLPGGERLDIPGPLRDGQSIVLSPASRPHLARASTQLHVGTPRIEAPAGIGANAAPGQAVTRTFDIGNSGNLALAWSLDRASPSAHFPPTRRWVVPPRQSGLTPSPPGARHGTAFDAKAAAFDVPAYGAKRENTLNNLGGVNYVTFNANAPVEFVPVLFNSVGTQGGDFIDDDFSKQYILYSANDGDTVMLFVLDYADFSAHAVSGPLYTVPAVGQRLAGLAWDRTTRTLFASSAMRGGSGQVCDEQVADGSSALYTIDPHTGEQRTVGPIAFGDGRPLCVSDIAVSPGGLMYGIDLLNDALVAIDKTNGHAALIGSVGFDLSEVNSMDFDDVTGTLYLAAFHHASFVAPDSGGIYTVDLVTGLAQRVAAYPLTSNNNGYLQIDALSIARAGGQCAFPGDIPWLRYDVAGGTTAPGGRSPVTLTLDATGLAAGRHAASVCISSNDRARPVLALPVSFTVSGTDTIFANGFDATP